MIKINQIKQRVKLKLHPELKPTNPPFELHFSKKQKYLSCLISKNGCSSILASIMKYDFGENFTIGENDKIWKMQDVWMPHESEHKLYFSSEKDIDFEDYDDYVKFVVLRNPFDRFISFINNTYKEQEYGYLFDKSLSAEKYVDCVLKMYPHIIDYSCPDRKYDKHAVPQRVYFEKYKQIFGNDLEIVMIKDLPDFYLSLTGHPLIKNNVTGESQKICTCDSLTRKQIKLIEKYILKYEFPKDDEYTLLMNS